MTLLAPRPTARSALLCVGGIEVMGLLDEGQGLVFSSNSRLHPHDSRAIVEGGSGELIWTDGVARFEQVVGIAPGRVREEFLLERIGVAQRVQRRSAVRAKVTVPVRVLTCSPDAATLRHAETIDLSSAGAAVLFAREPGAPDGIVIPKAGTIVGAIVEVPGRPVAAMAEVVGPIVTPWRAGMRLRFVRMRRRENEALAQFIVVTEVRGPVMSSTAVAGGDDDVARAERGDHGEGDARGGSAAGAPLVRTPRRDPSAALLVDVKGRVRELALLSRTATALRLDPIGRAGLAGGEFDGDVGAQVLVATPDDTWSIGVVGASDVDELVVHLVAGRPSR